MSFVAMTHILFSIASMIYVLMAVSLSDEATLEGRTTITTTPAFRCTETTKKA